MGNNIRAGAHYTQFIVYDFDSDGKVENIGDAKENYRNNNGKILTDPESITVFNGITGAAMETVNYLPPRHPETENPTAEQLEEIFEDDSGNRSDRLLAGVGYFDR